MKDTNWKPSNKYGSYYRIKNNTLEQNAMLSDGSMDDNEGSVDERAFALEEIAPFINEMSKLFGDEKIEFIKKQIWGTT